MARGHFAYRFDPKGAAEPFRALVHCDAASVLASLRRRAKAAVRRASPSLREALVAMRYDEGWTGSDPEEADREAKCFAIGLLADCEIAPSLGRPDETLYHVVIEPLLADAGWSSEDIGRLLRGEPLHGYLQAAGLDALASALTGLDDLAGWLGHERAREAASDLARVGDYFERQNQRHAIVLAQIAPAWAPRAGDLARQAYARAMTMLAATGPKADLLLVMD